MVEFCAILAGFMDTSSKSCELELLPCRRLHESLPCVTWVQHVLKYSFALRCPLASRAEVKLCEICSGALKASSSIICFHASAVSMLQVGEVLPCPRRHELPPCMRCLQYVSVFFIVTCPVTCCSVVRCGWLLLQRKNGNV